MVSAVFHSPLKGRGPLPAGSPAASPVAKAAGTRSVATDPPAASAKPRRAPRDLRAFWLRVLPPLLGFGVLVLIWELIAMKSTTGFPSPLKTWQQALVVFSDPFYSKGPNDQGVGWNVLASLQRVGLG